NAGGLEHPNWRENMKLALKLQSHISKKYPNLMRGVNLRKERFNGHTTYGSMIIEVGSSGNTIEEAIRGAKYGASEIGDFLNSVK
ncbi:MAG: stage II sporulation protein P, partial [Eubacteriales bacterium]|nr:stage II sporulation protein P [Eubacteriales bacterium]